MIFETVATIAAVSAFAISQKTKYPSPECVGALNPDNSSPSKEYEEFYLWCVDKGVKYEDVRSQSLFVNGGYKRCQYKGEVVYSVPGTNKRLFTVDLQTGEYEDGEELTITTMIESYVH